MKAAKTVKAINNSAAYIKAYEDFCISLKVNNDMRQSLGKIYSKTDRFNLLNEKGENIRNPIYNIDEKKQEKDI